ncbi:hypothetical protein EVAR_77845_1 [Eumeta japonica]|uniref:Uncharacterized protein n=1 Tax=Eumeta variegata TaxID=151549 RepID=A0A4C1TE71_EUMVA|nr:hypothetical protein EVAR_77845_1 [Eumeta japonica]
MFTTRGIPLTVPNDRHCHSGVHGLYPSHGPRQVCSLNAVKHPEVGIWTQKTKNVGLRNVVCSHEGGEWWTRNKCLWSPLTAIGRRLQVLKKKHTNIAHSPLMSETPEHKVKKKAAKCNSNSRTEEHFDVVTEGATKLH